MNDISIPVDPTKLGPSIETHFGKALLWWVDTDNILWHFHRTAIWEQGEKGFRLSQLNVLESILAPGIIYRIPGNFYNGIVFNPPEQEKGPFHATVSDPQGNNNTSGEDGQSNAGSPPYAIPIPVIY